MNADELIALNEEIAGLARAGLPLDQGLAALAREMDRGRLRKVTLAIANDLRAGQTLPQALERQGKRVPPFYAALVAAGVRTGHIGETLATLTTYARSLGNLRMILIDAIFYPAVVLVFAAGMFAFLCFVILPQFAQIFKDFNLKLPLLTEWTLVLGQVPPQAVVLAILLLLYAVVLLKLNLSMRERGRCYWARLVYAIPLVGTLIRSARLAAFSELLAILVDSELPLPEAFRLAGASSSDPIMAAASRHIYQNLCQGLPLGQALRGRGLVPEWVSWMTGLGERRGTLGQTLHHIAEMYRRQVEMRANLLRSVLPPLLIIGTAGVFVGFFGVSLMLPMLRLLEGMTK